MIYSLLLVILLPVVLIAALLILYRKYLLLRRQNKELQQANAAKDKLFTIIGHDLHGSISSLQPIIELYRLPDTTAEEKEFLLESMEENTHTAVETLRTLLNWGKAQIKGITLEQTYFNATEVIKNKLNLFRIAVKRKHLIIVNNLPEETNIYADINHFKFITRNLLLNAVKFSKEGGTIEINALKYQQPEYVIFSIKDNGIGMEKDKLQQIFQPFATSTNGTANEKGNGIGLLLCKEYANENGGDIWAESKIDVGSTFYFALKTFPHNEPFKSVK
jgi:signal transduction histidine kinase